MIEYDDDAYARAKKTREEAQAAKKRVRLNGQYAKEKLRDDHDPRSYKYPIGSSEGRKTRELRRDLVAQKAINLELVTSLEFEAWKLRTMGHKIYEIAELLRVTTSQVTVWLQDALAQVRGTTRELIDLDRELELSRTEELLKHYMPLALFDSVVFERMKQGEPIEMEDFEAPQRAAYIVLELIKLRCKIKGLTISEAEREMLPAVDVVGWLRTQHEFIKTAAQDAPRDVLSLDVDNPIDQHEQRQQKTETRPDQPSAQDFPDAV